MRHILPRALSALFLLASLFAADTTGTVEGTVADPSGAVLPNAEVALVNQATNVAVTRQTDADGRFTFNLVPPGTYTLRATLQGFRTAVTTDMLVEINKTIKADLVMTLGAVSESVSVSASAVQIDTASAQVSTNVSQKLVTELPSSSRNALSFAELSPGVTITNGASQVMNIEGTYATVNGNRRGRNVFYLDGSDNTGSFRNSALQFPNPEAVQEVNVTTSNTSAEFGKQPGGTFNVVTRSGTNEFHGAGFYYFRNEALNANSWNRNASGADRPMDRLKQGGGTLGGPIWRNKTFFFTSFMAYRDNSNGFQNTIKFPTAANVRGDFSGFGQQLYDPDTGQPLAGNIIPARLLDPVAQNLLKLFPTVNNFGDKYIWSFQNPIENQEWLGKIDHVFSPAHRVMFSYFKTWGSTSLPSVNGGANNVPAFGPQVNVSDQNTYSARHTWLASPNILIESRFAYAGLAVDRGQANLGQNLADFGANYPTVQEGARKYLPQITISDGVNSRQGNLSYFDQHNLRFGSTLSWVKGKHNLKFGAEFQRDTVFQRNDQDALNLTFDGRASSTVNGRATGTGVFGYALADFLMGRAASFSLSGILNYNLFNWSDFFFVQDEWKITPRLTLTPGLRYEIYTPATETDNRSVAFVLGHRSNLYPNAPANLAFAGDQGVPSGYVQPDRNNFAPRLGIAYDVFGNGKMAVRGGVGYYYAYNSTQIRMWNAEAPPWRPNATGGNTTGLTDIFGTSRTVVFRNPPIPFTTDVSNFNYPPLLSNSIGFDPGFRTPYSLQWNVSVERELTRGIKVNVGYVANRGFKLLQMLPGNLPEWRDNASLNNIDQRRPIAGYGNIGIIHTRARSWYDSLQFTTDFRITRGLTGRFYYVYARAFEIVSDDPTGNGNIQTANPQNWDAEKAPADRRHLARYFLVYDLPFWRNAKTWYGRGLGGWQLSSTSTFSSGTPFDVTLGEDWNYDSAAGDRPNLASPIVYTGGSKDARAARFFDPAVFALPGTRNTFGNLPRNALWGPGSWNVDAALLKNFRVTERWNLQVRAEAYDLFNHNNLTNPVGNLRSPDFGRILTRSGNRSMQIGARLLF